MSDVGFPGLDRLVWIIGALSVVALIAIGAGATLLLRAWRKRGR